MNPDDPMQLTDQELIAYHRLYREPRWAGDPIVHDAVKDLRKELDRRRIFVIVRP